MDKNRGCHPSPRSHTRNSCGCKSSRESKRGTTTKNCFIKSVHHGHFDNSACYGYYEPKLTNHYLTEEGLTASLEEFETLSVNL